MLPTKVLLFADTPRLCHCLPVTRNSGRGRRARLEGSQSVYLLQGYVISNLVRVARTKAGRRGWSHALAYHVRHSLVAALQGSP
jgi:hypothetical protein